MAVVTWERAPRGRGARVPTEIPARRADVVPIPDGLHPRVSTALAGLGLDGLYRPPGGGLHAAARGRAPGRRHRDRERQDAGLQPARAERARGGAEAARPLPVSHEGPRAGSGSLARRASSSRACARRSTTATPRPSGAGRSANGRTSILTNPDMLHVGRPPAPRPLGGRPPEPPLRRRRRGARLPRRLRVARRQRPAGACAARRRSTAPTRSFSSPRRRSPTPASSRSLCSASTRP